MREIRFKVWDKKNKIMIHEDFDSDEIYEKTKDKAYYGDEYYPLCHVDFMFPVSNSNFEMLQFTGLLDKNGVEIFEGDIIGFDMDTFYKRIFTVIYDSGRFGIQTDEGFRCLSDWIIIQKDNNTISCEVIGNVYKNSELLNKG